MNGTYTAFLLAGTVLLAPGCKESQDTRGTEERIPVEVRTMKPASLDQSLRYAGDIKAEYEVRIFSRVPDRIRKIHVENGSVVSKGDLLVEIESAALQQNVRQAEAALTAAQAQAANIGVEYERMRRLLAENAVSRQQFDAVRTQHEAANAQVKQARAMLEAARSQLADASIKAPVGGLVALRSVDEGDMASPAVSLMTIVQMDRVIVGFDAPDGDLGRLRQGARAHVRVRSRPDTVFEGTVSMISPVLDPATRMARIEVTVENLRHELKPGMFASVEVQTGRLAGVFVVPRFAVIENTRIAEEEGKNRVVKDYIVFVVNGERAERRALTVVYENHEALAVRGGIAAGERLVTMGQHLLRDGALVQITREEGVTP